jgi:hypothetical protein
MLHAELEQLTPRIASWRCQLDRRVASDLAVDLKFG